MENHHEHGHEHGSSTNEHEKEGGHEHCEAGSHDHQAHSHGSSSHEHGHGYGHGSSHEHAHGHSHEHLSGPGTFEERELPTKKRKYNSRAFTVGIGGPVGSGKTALMLQLCLAMRDKHNVCAVTNDIFTKEDGDFLKKHHALDDSRILAVETGGCPHAAIREDITANIIACEELTRKHKCSIVLLESGGDNLAADFSRNLADYSIYVIDVAGGDKIPRKGGPGITQSDLLVINKIDLADAVGASLDVMRRDARLMRGQGPVLFTKVKFGDGVSDIIEHILRAAADAGRK